jgi:Bacterial type III secretion protein (HrpB1_HrpK)
MAQKLGVDIRAIRILLETGVLASYEGLHAEGEAMVREVQSFRDDVPQPGVCLVSAFYFQGRHDDAITEAKALLKKFPNCQMAKALMGACMFSAGYRNWQTPLKEVMDDGRDEWAIDMARTVLGYEYLAPSSAKSAVQQPHVGAIFA